eukprot:152861_1
MTLFKVSQMPTRTVMQHHDDKIDHGPNVIHPNEHGVNLLKSPKTNRNIKGTVPYKFSLSSRPTYGVHFISKYVNPHWLYAAYRITAVPPKHSYHTAAHSTNSNGQNSSNQAHNNDNQNSNRKGTQHSNNNSSNQENVNHNCNGNDDDNNGDKNKRNDWQQSEQEHAQDQEEEEEEEKMMETLQEDQDMEFESDFIFGDRVTIDKDLNDIFAELSLEKEFSDILSTANPLPALQTLPSTSSHGTTASHTTHGHSPNAKTKKRKTKKRKKLKKSERNSGASYNPNPLYRAQGNIQISKQFTAEMIPCEITESITNLYGFMDKCTALCLMEERQDHEEDVLRIFNYGFHSKHSNETLYCVVQRQDVAVNASRGYKWKMLTKLYTMQAIAHEFGIHKAPKSLYDTVLYKSYLIQQQRIVSVISNVDSMRNLINNTQWHRIDIFNKVNNKRRMHLFLTKPEFMKECRQFVVNHWKSNALSFDLIPILMFNDECNEYWIEHVWIIRIDEEDISIGISFKYTINNQVKVAGIHLDKELLIDQHQLIVPNHECHCLDAFESNINYLSIGNPDDSLNKIKYYKQQIEELTKCKEQLQEQQQYHRYHINNHIHNEQMFKM